MRMQITGLFLCWIGWVSLVQGQAIQKPRGCFAGTNGTNAQAMAHPESRGVLLLERWKEIEPVPGNFDFNGLDAKISTVKAAGLPYSLAIGAGAFGSPAWLVDSFGVDHTSYLYAGNTQILPIWWDSLVTLRLHRLIDSVGTRYAHDTSLSHVYVSQMTTNGVEGHLNGVPTDSLLAHGFTNQKWIDAAKATVYKYAENFPDIPLVFEVHEIDQDTSVPARIMRELYQDSSLCQRVGLAMWWISGKISYQGDLLDFIENFPGDKYAQVIGRSDQPTRFENGDYGTVFSQAKQLGIRYLEPWPYEFQMNTHDSLIADFNQWCDAQFSSEDSCLPFLVSTEERSGSVWTVYPNPIDHSFFVETAHLPISQVEIYNSQGSMVKRIGGDRSQKLLIQRDGLGAGIYFCRVQLSNASILTRPLWFR